jgi:hypothetical protein
MASSSTSGLWSSALSNMEKKCLVKIHQGIYFPWQRFDLNQLSLVLLNERKMTPVLTNDGWMVSNMLLQPPVSNPVGPNRPFAKIPFCPAPSVCPSTKNIKISWTLHWYNNSIEDRT